MQNPGISSRVNSPLRSGAGAVCGDKKNSPHPHHVCSDAHNNNNNNNNTSSKTHGVSSKGSTSASSTGRRMHRRKSPPPSSSLAPVSASVSISSGNISSRSSASTLIRRLDLVFLGGLTLMLALSSMFALHILSNQMMPPQQQQQQQQQSEKLQKVAQVPKQLWLRPVGHVNNQTTTTTLKQNIDDYVSKSKLKSKHSKHESNPQKQTLQQQHYSRILTLHTLQNATSYNHPPPTTANHKKTHFKKDPMLHVQSSQAPPPQQLRAPYTIGNCVPMTEWQTDAKPNCNVLHEMDLTRHSIGPTTSTDNHHHDNTKQQQQQAELDTSQSRKPIKLLAMGWFRHAWKVYLQQPHASSQQEEVILKTLRYEREFFDEYHDLHRRDAMAMERLTSSPYTLDIYGYCAQSALNEVAADNIERVAMRYRNLEKYRQKDRAEVWRKWNEKKLWLAYKVARGVADVHEVDYKPKPPSPTMDTLDDSRNDTSAAGHSNETAMWVTNATMVHYDLNPRNVAIMADGSVKLNDFNVAEFLRWDTVKNQSCGFVGRLREPWWRAPEEMITQDPQEAQEKTLPHQPNITLNEKVDVYSLGNILYRILTGRAPRGKSITERIHIARKELLDGVLPALAKNVALDEDPCVKAIRVVMKACYERRPEDRPSARDVANYLGRAIEVLGAKDEFSLKPFISA